MLLGTNIISYFHKKDSRAKAYEPHLGGKTLFVSFMTVISENHDACITPEDARWPQQMTRRLGEQSPSKLWTLGNLSLLNERKAALFCSARCPGSAILAAYNQAAYWRATGRCVISGFPLVPESVKTAALEAFRQGV